jgi:hypothetical protein
VARALLPPGGCPHLERLLTGPPAVGACRRDREPRPHRHGVHPCRRGGRVSRRTTAGLRGTAASGGGCQADRTRISHTSLRIAVGDSVPRSPAASAPGQLPAGPGVLMHALDDRVTQTRPGLTGGTRSEAIRARRRLQKTDQWQRHYATRAGVESTIAQGVRRTGGASTRAHSCRSPPHPNRRLTDRDLTCGLPHLPLQPPEPRMDTAEVANGVPCGT